MKGKKKNLFLLSKTWLLYTQASTKGAHANETPPRTPEIRTECEFEDEARHFQRHRNSLPLYRQQREDRRHISRVASQNCGSSPLLGADVEHLEELQSGMEQVSTATHPPSGTQSQCSGRQAAKESGLAYPSSG